MPGLDRGSSDGGLGDDGSGDGDSGEDSLTSRSDSRSNSWFRPTLETMQGYQPGEWPALNSGVLKLNSNENPYPPSPKVLAAMAQFQGELLRRYPDPQAETFCQTVAETFGIPANWVIAGNGSDDVLTLIVRACAEGHQRVLAYPTPTYVLYRTLAAIQPAKTVEIPYEIGHEASYGASYEASYEAETESETWRLPVAQLIAAQAAVTLVATPNSPTGHQVSMTELRSLAVGLKGVLVIDEAYVDFAEPIADRRSLELVKEFENVIVLRTLSKGYALAGLRVGFGCAQPALLAGLKKVKDSYNVDAIALHLGAIAIADQAYKNAIAAKVVAARGQLAADLRSLNFRVWRSQANFLLVQPSVRTFGQSPGQSPGQSSRRSAEHLYQQLKARQIMIRYFNEPGLDDKLRITVGTPEQNARMLDAIAEIVQTGII